MPRRARLTTVRLFSALRDTFAEAPYSLPALGRDAIAGITVGIVAIPLAMALAIASGMPPERGLYTAAIAGLVAALAGGSRFSVTGPTAAFVVILAPIAHKYGFTGLGTATVMAGVLLVVLGAAKLGRLIEYVPEPVVIGFTGGIAIVLATLQLNDALGLGVTDLPEHFAEKALALTRALPNLDPAAAAVAALTLAVLIFWPTKRLVIPGHLPALLIGSLAAFVLARAGHPIDTIGTRFTYALANGGVGHGIPSALPHFSLPWAAEAGASAPLTLSMLRDLVPVALSMAVLGSIESLLCAVAIDNMTGTRHHANGELVGQGLANIAAPFFGGFTATAAIARSATNVKAGARSPIASVVHAIVVLAAIALLAPTLSFVPMASMGALLIMVAWNMSDAPKAVELVKTAPRGDILVFATCLALTVFVDMVAAIGVGVVLASFLFMRKMSELTVARDITDSPKHVPDGVPNGWHVYSVNGPLFFAAAEKVFTQVLEEVEDRSGVILYLDAVTVLDAGGLSAFERFREECERRHVKVIVADAQPQPKQALSHAGVAAIAGSLALEDTLAGALTRAQKHGDIGRGAA